MAGPSAGRFHHAQSQVHRFLNTTLGGYVRSVNSYSAGAAGVILPHVLGPMESVSRRNVTWDQVAEHSEVVLAFGGMALKNSMVAGGGISKHIERGAMQAAAARGCGFIGVGPLRDDMPAEARRRVAARSRPDTDTALMLAIMHTLVAEGLHDRDFLDRYTVGWPVLEAYLLGREDGQPKDAAWAAPITGIAGRTHHRAGAPPGGQARAGHRLAFAAARRAWRAAGLGRHRAGRGARADRPARRRLQLRARRAGPYRAALQRGVHRGAAAGAQPRSAPTSPSRASADMLLNPGDGVRVQRPAPDLSRYRAGLLGRRQSLPPPPGPQPAARGVPPRRHAGRARAGLDRDGAARRYRPAGDDDPGAGGYRQQPDRPADGRHAPAGRALWRGARRLRDLRRPRRAAGQGATAFTEGRSARDWLRHLLRPHRATTCAPRAMPRRSSRSSGRRAT